METFQFTHPVRGATSRHISGTSLFKCFNSRTPCGVRQSDSSLYVRVQKFQFTHPVRGATISRAYAVEKKRVSIHAPRAGCDYTLVLGSPRARRFNSRTPCGVRLQARLVVEIVALVSIHAPRAGCDQDQNTPTKASLSFNSRTPCGVRQQLSSPPIETPVFQFTHPVRGATTDYPHLTLSYDVSIHAPRAGCDYLCSVRKEEVNAFQFTHPVRGATPDNRIFSFVGEGFNSRTPCGVRHLECKIQGKLDGVSIHAPRAGCDCDAQRYA